jgi:BNR repeat-like domain
MSQGRIYLMRLLIAGLIATVGAWRSDVLAGNKSFRLARFRADVTVPLGHRLMGILPARAARVADPLEARGFVLLGADAPIVWIAVDWCEIRNEAYQRWREVMAGAAGTESSRVILTCLHQHDAPVADLGAQRLLDEVGLEKQLCDPEFHEAAVQRVAKALRTSLASARRATHIGVGQGIVHDVASNRRVVLEGRHVAFGRGSNSGGDRLMREAPDGLIDPWLRTVSFWDGDEPLLALHSYATHPMSYYGRGEVSADFVGLARRMRQQDNPHVFQIYATGCAGDVTAGKYNDGAPENRPILAKRLHASMQEAWRNTRRWPLETVQLRSVDMTLPFRGGELFAATALRQTLNDSTADERSRILAAMALASRQRIESGNKLSVPCLDFERTLLVSLPGESFVGYQLMAQRLRPDVPVVCFGYGECWTGYIPTRAAFADGFTDQWLWVDRGADVAMRTALINVLRMPRSHVLSRAIAGSSGGVSSDVFTASTDHPRYSEGSILPLADGSLLFVNSEFDKSSSDFAPARIVARRSRDGGNTWGRSEIVQDNVGRLNVMSATLRRFRAQQEGTIGLFYLVKNNQYDLKVYLRTSANEGRNFGGPLLVTDAPGYQVMNNDRVTELTDGRLLCPVAWTRDIKNEDHFVSFCYWSDDEGTKWVTGKSRVDVPKRGAMEPEVLELDDGRVLMIVRTQLGEIYASYSNDRGESWSSAERWGIRSPESPATLRRIPATGDLLLVWNPVYEAGAGHGGKRTPLVAAVSRNEGRTWSEPRTLEGRADQEYAYTSLTFFEHRVLLSYYVADRSTACISTRFRSLPLNWFYEPAPKN